MALPAVKAPYTREHMKVVKNALRTIHDHWPMLDRMEQCNFPGCEVLREKLETLQKQFALILNKFGGEDV